PLQRIVPTQQSLLLLLPTWCSRTSCLLRLVTVEVFVHNNIRLLDLLLRLRPARWGWIRRVAKVQFDDGYVFDIGVGLGGCLRCANIEGIVHIDSSSLSA